MAYSFLWELPNPASERVHDDECDDRQGDDEHPTRGVRFLVGQERKDQNDGDDDGRSQHAVVLVPAVHGV
jgi:hypothetical protein